MPAFEDLDWTRFDVDAIVNGRGIGVIDPSRAVACRSWLERQGYAVETWDFAGGVNAAVTHLGERLRWEEQFGYTLLGESRNLDALRDGFLSDEWRSQALALVVEGADAAWREAPEWFLAVLSIAQEHSLCELAVGRRFFLVLVLEEGSPVVGKVVDTVRVPAPYWRPGRSGKDVG